MFATVDRLIIGLLALLSIAHIPLAHCQAWQDLKPVASWSFGTEDTSKISLVGGVHRDQPGPRPPEFPDFEAANTAIKLDGRGARCIVSDPGVSSDFDFDNGDSITIEAWVNITESLGNDRNVYVIGKGRTGDSKFAADNQNWALRIRSVDGVGRISFLFATDKNSEGEKSGSPWHRWTSQQGFVPGTGWHRIAVCYEFGKPESIRGWLNENRLDGKWDMGGSTKQAPVVDDDAVWIGSALSGGAGNSFEGWIDQISLFRSALSDQQMLARYRRSGKDRDLLQAAQSNQPPEFAPQPSVVSVRVFEGLPGHDRWSPATTYEQSKVSEFALPHMLIPRLPLRYDDWGIRASWRSTVLLQATCQIQLPAGQHELLLRGRGLSRVWLDDQVVAKLGVRKSASDGHNPVEPLPEPPAPNNRRVGYGDLESLVPLKIDAPGIHQLTLETLVGSNKTRAEPGETLVAWRPEGQADFVLIQPQDLSASPVPLREQQINHQLELLASHLRELDDKTRRAAAASQDNYWQRRRQFASDWVKSQPPIESNSATDGAIKSSSSDSASNSSSSLQSSNQNSIDQFLKAKVVAAKSEVGTGSPTEIEHFQQIVLPIFRDHCMRCHATKAEGGLQLLSRELVLRGGDSGEPGIVIGSPVESELIRRMRSTDSSERMPPSGNLTQSQIAAVDHWVKDGGAWGRKLDQAQLTPTEVVDDASFLRRAYLDTCGVPPTEQQAREFLASTDSDKRGQLIKSLLDDPRLADHWVSYWQDVLAENPNILKPSLNNTGPFRYFLYESLLDGKPIDRMVTELLMLRGSEREGGSAGFGMAADNDAPLATRSIVVASAFLGVNLQCARCHDSPYHSTKQADLYAAAAMLARKPLSVPKSSTVAPGFFDTEKGRQSLIKVSLKPGVPVEPNWCFASATGVQDGPWVDDLLQSPGDLRERLAALITSPNNQRFAEMIVNRVWKRLMGAGFVEPADDWENQQASHPELLKWLARQFVMSGYDFRRLIELIMTSEAYQRQAAGHNIEAVADERFFMAPDRRRLTAEQVVDSLFSTSGQSMEVDEISFDSDNRHSADVMISLGKPNRAWQFGALSNERDRPSLSLPRAQMVTDVLEAFGWNGSRQNAITMRDQQPNVIQPGILAGGVLTTWITRASQASPLANLACQTTSAEQLVDSLYLRLLTRLPNEVERRQATELLSIGFDRRMLPKDEIVPPKILPQLSYVSWTNHLKGEANEIMLEHDRRVRAGPAADPRLEPQWREALEDLVWSLVNSPEFVWVP